MSTRKVSLSKNVRTPGLASSPERASLPGGSSSKRVSNLLSPFMLELVGKDSEVLNLPSTLPVRRKSIIWATEVVHDLSKLAQIQIELLAQKESGVALSLPQVGILANTERRSSLMAPLMSDLVNDPGRSLKGNMITSGNVPYEPFLQEDTSLSKKKIHHIIDEINASWMRQEDVESEEAILVENWLNRVLARVFNMADVSLESGGLRAAGLSRKQLLENGLNEKQVDALYRDLYAHSAGLYDTLIGGRGFEVRHEESEKIMAAFKLLTSFFQQTGTTDCLFLTEIDLDNKGSRLNEPEVKMLQGLKAKEKALLETRSQLEVKCLLMARELQAEHKKNQLLEHDNKDFKLSVEISESSRAKIEQEYAKAKEEWNASRDELMNKISQAGPILQSEKRKSEMLKLQVTQNEDELNALHTDRLAITQINMETDIEVRRKLSLLETMEAEIAGKAAEVEKLRRDSLELKLGKETYDALYQSEVAKSAQLQADMEHLKKEYMSGSVMQALKEDNDKKRAALLRLEQDKDLLGSRLQSIDEDLHIGVLKIGAVRLIPEPLQEERNLDKKNLTASVSSITQSSSIILDELGKAKLEAEMERRVSEELAKKVKDMEVWAKTDSDSKESLKEELAKAKELLDEYEKKTQQSLFETQKLGEEYEARLTLAKLEMATKAREFEEMFNQSAAEVAAKTQEYELKLQNMAIEMATQKEEGVKRLQEGLANAAAGEKENYERKLQEELATAEIDIEQRLTKELLSEDVSTSQKPLVNLRISGVSVQPQPHRLLSKKRGSRIAIPELVEGEKK